MQPWLGRVCGGVRTGCFAGARSVAVGLASALLPAECRVCALPLDNLKVLPVCESCLRALRPQAEEAGCESPCVCCGGVRGMESSRFEAARGEGRCHTCRLASLEFERAVAYGLYGGELRELLHLVKYERVSTVATTLLGDRLALAVETLHGVCAPDALVVAVPLFAARQQERGFNQAQLLAHAAVGRLRRRGWRLREDHAVLERARDTRQQFTMTPRQRRDNLRGAFRVAHAKRLSGRDVLLIDDIMTTGATARECARVLRKGGAARVFVATVARAQEELLVARWTLGDLGTSGQQGAAGYDVSTWTQV